MKLNLKNWIFVILFLASLINIDNVFAQQDSGICCLEENGFCSSNKLADNCVRGGGSVLAGGSCYDANRVSTFPSCQLVGCVFIATGQCTFVSNERCGVLGGAIDPSITTQVQCNNYQPPIVSSGTAGATVVRNVCSNDKRKIIGLDASNNPISEIETCFDNEKCVDANDVPECVSTSCKVGENTVLRTYNIGTGKLFIEETGITHEMMGVKLNSASRTIAPPVERRDGESWCMIYGSDDGENWNLLPKFYTTKQVYLSEVSDSDKYSATYMKSDYKKYSAGQRHSVYRCDSGNIVVEQGDLFRDVGGICLENSEPEYYFIGQEDEEKWATCQARNINDREKYIDAIKEVEDNVYTPVLEDLSVVRNPRARPSATSTSPDSRIQDYSDYKLNDGFSHARLVDNWDTRTRSNSGESITCRAKYPIGNEFYDDGVVEVIAPEIRCNSCGDGFWNQCDDNECYRKGDCSYDEGTGVLGGCVKGAAIAEAIYLTAGSIGLHSGGGWSSVFVSGAPTNAAGGIQTGTFSTGQSGIGVSSSVGGQGGIGVSNVPQVSSGFTLDSSLATSSNIGLGVSSTSGSSYSLTNSAFQTVAVEGGKTGLKVVGKSLSATQQVAQYITTAYGAGQVVNAVFNGDRAVRVDPSVDSTNVGTLEAGESVRLVGATTDSFGNVWGRTDFGGNVMLNSPTEVNPAIITITNEV